jgi:hypothetical protein
MGRDGRLAGVEEDGFIQRCMGVRPFVLRVDELGCGADGGN